MKQMNSLPHGLSHHLMYRCKTGSQKLPRPISPLNRLGVSVTADQASTPGAGASQSPAQTEWTGEALLLLLTWDPCFWQGIHRLVGKTSKNNPPIPSKLKPHTVYKNLLKVDHRLSNYSYKLSGGNSRSSGSRGRWKALRLYKQNDP